MIRLLIVANPTLEQEEVNTEKERTMLQKIQELEESNRSLRQNLLDTLNELKSTEKENELIFAEKLKLLKQLGNFDEELDRSIKSQRRVNDQTPSVTKEVPTAKPLADKTQHNEYKYRTQKQIEDDNEFFEQNDDLINRSDNMINKYNSVIKSNLEATKVDQSSKGYPPIAPKISGLHKIDETGTEEDYASRRSIDNMGESYAYHRGNNDEELEEEKK